MRTHIDVIRDAGGYQKVAEIIGEPSSRVRFWTRRASIPADAWSVVADRGVATLDELATAAAAKRKRPPT